MEAYKDLVIEPDTMTLSNWQPKSPTEKDIKIRQLGKIKDCGYEYYKCVKSNFVCIKSWGLKEIITIDLNNVQLKGFVYGKPRKKLAVGLKKGNYDFELILKKPFIGIIKA